MTKILGFPLPPAYEWLVATATWESPEWRVQFKRKARANGMCSDAYFLRPTQMEGWIRRFLAFRERVGPAELARELLVDASTTTTDSVRSGHIDLKRGLPLADNGGDAWLWLDYRNGDEPQVLEFTDAPAKWSVLAGTFQELADRVLLSDRPA